MDSVGVVYGQCGRGLYSVGVVYGHCEHGLWTMWAWFMDSWRVVC